MGGEALGAPGDWWWVYRIFCHLLTLSGLCLAPGNPWFWPGFGGAVGMPLNLFGSTNATDFRVRWTGGDIPVTAAGGGLSHILTTAIISTGVNHCDYLRLLKVVIIHRRSDIIQNESYLSSNNKSSKTPIMTCKYMPSGD